MIGAINLWSKTGCDDCECDKNYLHKMKYNKCRYCYLHEITKLLIGSQWSMSIQHAQSILEN